MLKAITTTSRVVRSALPVLFFVFLLTNIYCLQNSSSTTKVSLYLLSQHLKETDKTRPSPPEQFHSTPETQTDESYNHPEDLEHFAMHEEIEHKEAEKEAKYQGITVEEAIHQHEEAAAEAQRKFDEYQAQVHQQDGEAGQQPLGGSGRDPNGTGMNGKKVNRVSPPENAAPEVKYKDASDSKGQQAEWGAGDKGYKAPKNPSDRMRLVLSPSLFSYHCPHAPRLVFAGKTSHTRYALLSSSSGGFSTTLTGSHAVQIPSKLG